MRVIRDSGFQNIVLKYRCDSRAKTANFRFEHKICKEDVADILLKYNFKCFYCNDSISYKNWQLDHFHPKANGGLNKPENLVCCCKWCNTMKNALDGHAFIDKCSIIVEKNFFKLNSVDFEKREIFNSGKVKKAAKKLQLLGVEVNEDVKAILLNLTKL